jgi:hypothetical protein
MRRNARNVQRENLWHTHLCYVTRLAMKKKKAARGRGGAVAGPAARAGAPGAGLAVRQCAMAATLAS